MYEQAVQQIRDKADELCRKMFELESRLQDAKSEDEGMGLVNEALIYLGREAVLGWTAAAVLGEQLDAALTQLSLFNIKEVV